MKRVPFLPKIKYERVASLETRGNWEHSDTLIKTIPEDLDISGEVSKDVLTAIPTVWARPLLFAQALFDENHPLHNEVEKEWRGLLGCFCFKKAFNFNITIEEVSFVKEAENPADKKFQEILNKSPRPEEWEKIYLIYLDNILIGGTEPDCLFFTPSEYQPPASIPWTENGVLYDPADYFKKHKMSEHLYVLYKWVEEMEKGIGASSLKEEQKNSLQKRFREWKENIDKDKKREVATNFCSISEIDKPYSIVFQYADFELKKGDYFLKSSRKPKEIIIVDLNTWKKEKEKFVYGSYKVEQVLKELENYGTTRDDIERWFKEKIGEIPEFVIPEEEFFTNKVLKIELNENYTLCASKNYLFPFKKKILDYFTSKEVKEYLSCKEKDGKLIAELSIPLKENRKLIVKKTYEKMDIVKIRDIPIIALWPDFSSDDWFWYYLFIQKTDPKLKYEVVSFDTPKEQKTEEKVDKPTSEEIENEYIIWNSSKPIEAIECFYENEEVGLIIPNLKNPANVRDAEWHVGIDFGTSNTTVAYREGDTLATLQFKDRILKLTERPPKEYLSRLYLYFMPYFKTKESINSIYRRFYEKEIPICSGIILHLDNNRAWATLNLFNVEKELKWTEDPQKRGHIFNYLKHLLLLILAEARGEYGIKKFTFYTSYPSAFPKGWRDDFLDNFKTHVLAYFNNEEDKKKEWQINFFIPEPKDEAEEKKKEEIKKKATESVAVCKYWIKSGVAIGGTLAACVVDIGGGTTDIGIWLQHNGRRQFKAQASVVLAARIISKLFSKDKGILKYFPNVDVEDVEFLNDEKSMHAMLNSILKSYEDELLKIVSQHSRTGFKKPRSVIMAAYGGVFYYLGILLRATCREIEGCDILLSGNGAKLLKWIGGDYTSALRKFINGGFALKDLSPINFRFSENPKEEVALGLVVEEELEITEPIKIIGEEGYLLENSSLAWNKNLLELEKTDFSKIKVPNKFPELENYIYIYNSSTEQLGLEKKKCDNNLKVQIKNMLESRIRGIRPDQNSELLQPFFIEEVKAFIDLFI